MTRQRILLDPVLPRFCAQTGASLPLAWELAWSQQDQAQDNVLGLTPPPAPRETDRLVWPRRLPPGTGLRLPGNVRVEQTPVSFVRDGGPVTALFGPDLPAFAEVPRPVGELLQRGTSVAAVRDLWGTSEEAAGHLLADDVVVDHFLVGLLRLGLLHADPSPVAVRPGAAGRFLVQEAWTEAVERDPGEHFLASVPTGNFLKVGAAALRLWQCAGSGDGIPAGSLPAPLTDAADRMLSAGLLRAVAPE
ncbi:hypothetical protein [Streptomyces cinerochromogenes]|uniref:hypothetical protein n=1 Tax=Streptomyces cinerochromogenes TaxID=66422 RepID=UPI0033B8A626